MAAKEKTKYDKVLKEIYDQKEGSNGSIQSFIRKVERYFKEHKDIELSRPQKEDIVAFLNRMPEYQQVKETIVQKKDYIPIIAKPNIFQIDLIDFNNKEGYGDRSDNMLRGKGYRYGMCCVNIMTRKAYVYPQIGKTANETFKSYKKFLRDAHLTDDIQEEEEEPEGPDGEQQEEEDDEEDDEESSDSEGEEKEEKEEKKGIFPKPERVNAIPQELLSKLERKIQELPPELNTDALRRTLTDKYSVPRPFEITTDNGKEFSLIKDYNDEHSIRHEYCEPRDHTHMGKVERFNRTLRKKILDLQHGRQQWLPFLKQAVSNYNQYDANRAIFNKAPDELNDEDKWDIFMREEKAAQKPIAQSNEYKEGDRVRARRLRFNFDKGIGKYSNEVYNVEKRGPHNFGFQLRDNDGRLVPRLTQRKIIKMDEDGNVKEVKQVEKVLKGQPARFQYYNLHKVPADSFASERKGEYKSKQREEFEKESRAVQKLLLKMQKAPIAARAKLRQELKELREKEEEKKEKDKIAEQKRAEREIRNSEAEERRRQRQEEKEQKAIEDQQRRAEQESRRAINAVADEQRRQRAEQRRKAEEEAKEEQRQRES